MISFYDKDVIIPDYCIIAMAPEPDPADKMRVLVCEASRLLGSLQDQKWFIDRCNSGVPLDTGVRIECVYLCKEGVAYTSYKYDRVISGGSRGIKEVEL